MSEHTAENDAIPERVIRDIETHCAEARNAVDKTLVGYFVPIDQWRAIRALLRSIPPGRGD